MTAAVGGSRDHVFAPCALQSSPVLLCKLPRDSFTVGASCCDRADFVSFREVF